nr:hypothetical protein [uncultured Flavobacterium sp.]
MKNNYFNLSFLKDQLYCSISFDFLYYFFLPFYSSLIVMAISYYCSTGNIEQRFLVETTTSFLLPLSDLKEIDPIYLGPFLKE